MKTIKNFLIVVGLLLCFSIVTAAQVRQILDQPSSLIPKIKIEDYQLFAITPFGVYSQELDESGNLKEETLLPSKLFESLEFNISDFVVNGNKILVASTDSDKEIYSILKSEDGGRTWTILNEWEDLTGPVYIKRGNIQNLNELYIVIAERLFFTSDFGKTWDKKDSFRGELKKVSPLDSKICIACYETFFAVLDNKEFCISYDYGATWNYINSFIKTNDVAFHYSDVNKIVLNGDMILFSKDCGNTWETTKNWGYGDPDIYFFKSEFDTRGGDRLYATRGNDLLYSDDFGATWEELCSVGESTSDYITNFVQQNDKIYTISKAFKAYEVDLTLLETAVEEIASDNGNISINIEGNNLKINSQEAISSIEIYNISGVKLLSMDYNETAIDISELMKGTYVVRLHTTTDNAISIKFNK